VVADVARGLVGGVARQVLDPAIQASRALLPGGMGIETAAQRLTGQKNALTHNPIYQQATYVPPTTSGTIGSLIPLAVGAATGVATEGTIPTLATLTGGYVGGKGAEGTADVLMSSPSVTLTPEQREAVKYLAGMGGMFVGGAKAHAATENMTMPEAVTAVNQKTKASAQAVDQFIRNPRTQSTLGAIVAGASALPYGVRDAAIAASAAAKYAPEIARNLGLGPRPISEPTPNIPVGVAEIPNKVSASSSELPSGVPTRLGRQHNTATLRDANRALELAHEIHNLQVENPSQFSTFRNTKDDDLAITQKLIEFEKVAERISGKNFKPFAASRENIPKIGTINGLIANLSELTPAQKQALLAQAVEE
jgi:hypothetical protein